MSHVFNIPLPPNLRKDMVYLVVDDHDTMRKITVNQLRLLGADKILSARDGQEAMEILKSQQVDLVLSDWNMPVMDGLTLLKTMRSDPRLRAIALIMITAEAERSRVELAVANDVTSMILKPYTPAQLMNRIEKAADWKPRPIRPAPVANLQAGSAGQARTEAVVTKEPARPTLLLVDDTPDNLMLLSKLLRDDYRVRLAQNGAKALDICTSDDPPDLVLLDIMMPEMDGFEVAQRMREHPASESIPVIFVTALTGTDARLKGMDLGAVDFITKPIDPALLKPRVRNFMRYVQLRKDMQAEFDSMVETAKLRDHVDHITRHDLKGPLAGVIGLVQGMLGDEELGQRHQEQLRLLEETALQVLNMVNLSTELLKIETHTFQLKPTVVPVADILRRIAEMDRITFASKQLTISVDTDTPVGTDIPQALGDAMLCYSLFQNLLKNACEAAPAHSLITIKLHDQSPLCIEIKNKGAVAAEIRARFFEKFATFGKSSGSGLGTYSAKLLTEAQQGSIALQVDDGRDTTTVQVSLPRAPAAC